MKPRITERQWLKAKDVIDLDLYRTAWKQFREWRLFAAACCRRAMTLTPDPRLDALIATAERFADGVGTWEEMKKTRRILNTIRRELGDEFGPDEAKHDVLNALGYVTGKEPVGALGADQQARFAFAAKARPRFDAGHDREEREQVRLAYDIFGNPFRPVTFDPAWRTDTAVQLARGMYDSRDFSAMPILADALQDAGCDHSDVLTHCRGARPEGVPGEPVGGSPAPAVHVRGCWVVDLVLGKA